MNGKVESAFLDVGGVLVYDEPVELFYVNTLAGRLLHTEHRWLRTPRDLFAAREQFLSAGNRDWIHSLGREVLRPAEWRDLVTCSWAETRRNLGALFVPYPGALEAVRTLSGRFRLCCVANQPAEAEGVLDALGFLPYMEEVLFDDVVGVSKPDPAIFRLALERMRIGAEAAVYVGDRPDNDLLPARTLGMRTVWILRRPRYFKPKGVREEMAQEYYESLCRLWHHNCSETLGVAADLTGPSLASLVIGEREPWTS